MTTTLVKITGNTYPVKDQLKALGARWNIIERVWTISADKAEQAQALVAKGSAKSEFRPIRRSTCVVCGHRATGRYGDVIYRSGECRGCFEERKMGY